VLKRAKNKSALIIHTTDDEDVAYTNLHPDTNWPVKPHKKIILDPKSPIKCLVLQYLYNIPKKQWEWVVTDNPFIGNVDSSYNIPQKAKHRCTKKQRKTARILPAQDRYLFLKDRVFFYAKHIVGLKTSDIQQILKNGAPDSLRAKFCFLNNLKYHVPTLARPLLLSLTRSRGNKNLIHAWQWIACLLAQPSKVVSLSLHICHPKTHLCLDNLYQKIHKIPSQKAQEKVAKLFLDLCVKIHSAENEDGSLLPITKETYTQCLANWFSKTLQQGTYLSALALLKHIDPVFEMAKLQEKHGHAIPKNAPPFAHTKLTPPPLPKQLSGNNWSARLLLTKIDYLQASKALKNCLHTYPDKEDIIKGEAGVYLIKEHTTHTQAAAEISYTASSPKVTQILGAKNEVWEFANETAEFKATIEGEPTTQNLKDKFRALDPNVPPAPTLTKKTLIGTRGTQTIQIEISHTSLEDLESQTRMVIQTAFPNTIWRFKDPNLHLHPHSLEIVRIP
jgi:hypothetical protein